LRLLVNIDLGEQEGEPETLYACAHLANIACGGHAGDDGSMKLALTRCRAHGTRVGAHPSYPDRKGFGRRTMPIDSDVLRASVEQQCAALAKIADSLGEAVVFAKPHGALYHDARGKSALATALVAGIVAALGSDVTIVGPEAGELFAAALRANLRYAREGFADRATNPDGTLVPRDRPGALLLDPALCAERARSLASRGDIETICVHGDTPGAVSIAQAVRTAVDTWAEK
jgi:UPF0271 protein